MRGAVIHAPGDVLFESLDDPKILHPADAIRAAVSCVCGSDLWPYRGLEPVGDPHPMGHECVGFVEEVGSEVTSVKPGQFVVGSFATSDNTCANCRNGFQSNCLRREFMGTCQADCIRIPNAQGTLVATDGIPAEEPWPGLLAVSDVMGTGWWAADAGEVRLGSTIVVVGDGAVGLSAVIAAREMGAERITRRPGPRTPLPARPHRPCPVGPDQPGQGLRPHPAPRSGRRGLQGHGRTPRHQCPPHALTATRPTHRRTQDRERLPGAPHGLTRNSASPNGSQPADHGEARARPCPCLPVVGGVGGRDCGIGVRTVHVRGVHRARASRC